MQTALRDFRFAVRQLCRAPGFALLAVLTLALGTGANTAMFTVIESVLLRPLPYSDADRLVYIGPAGAEAFGPTSWLNYRDIRDQAQNLEITAGYSEDVGVVESKDASVSVLTPRVTPNLFRMLGAQPLIGRAFTDGEGAAGGPEVAMISEGLWREVFQGDPAIVGRMVRVNGRERAVVGVMPRSFRFPEPVGHDIERGIWLPLQPTAEMLKDRGYDFFTIVGKLRAGATLREAQAQLDLIAGRVRERDPGSGPDVAFRVAPYAQMLTGQVRAVFWSLSAALGLVLLIACGNVANLLIARCLGRQQEFAVRAALGAARWRLIRQVMAEGALLSVLGCCVGLALAYGALAAIHKLPPDTIPRGDELGIRWTVLLILALTAAVTTLLASLLPALFVATAEPQRVLQAASRGVAARAVEASLGRWLVGFEVALSTVLLVSTGLLFRTLSSLERAPLGFEVSRVTCFSAMPADVAGFANLGGYSEGQPALASVATLVYQPLLENIRHAPGVSHAALVTAPPFSGVDLTASFRVVGQPKNSDLAQEARLMAVSGDYLKTMGTPVVRGRELSDEDAANAAYNAAINQTFARRYFAGQNPLGRQIDLGGKSTGMLRPYTIVGVIADQIDSSPAEAPKPLLMLPYQQVPVTSLYYPALLKTVVHFVVKTRGKMPVAPEMRAIFRRTAPDFALDNFQTMQEALDQNNFSARLGLYLVGTFAGLAVLMVMAGLFGVLAQAVSYRRREIGVRLALGATPRTILRMFLLQGSRVVGLGLAAGVTLALCAGRLVKSFLYGVKPLDVETYVVVVAALFVIGIISAVVPARRAAGVDPMNTIREP
ncbi:MAG: ABC transporter permease [Terriglobia bacterium]|jgi:predicted permease